MSGGIVELIIPGKPFGKERPRSRSVNSKTGEPISLIYTPGKTKAYEALIQEEYISKYGMKLSFQEKVPLEISVAATFGVPKSTSKANRERMLNGELFPVVKPDGDNILKVIMDALNRLAYHDDAQVVKFSLNKVYGETENVSIRIREI